MLALSFSSRLSSTDQRSLTCRDAILCTNFVDNDIKALASPEFF